MSNTKDGYQHNSLFPEEPTTPREGLSKEEIPEIFTKNYKPSLNRVVIQFTDEQEEAVKKMLGLPEIKNVVYKFEELGK